MRIARSNSPGSGARHGLNLSTAVLLLFAINHAGKGRHWTQTVPRVMVAKKAGVVFQPGVFYWVCPGKGPIRGFTSSPSMQPLGQLARASSELWVAFCYVSPNLPSASISANRSLSYPIRRAGQPFIGECVISDW